MCFNSLSPSDVYMSEELSIIGLDKGLNGAKPLS